MIGCRLAAAFLHIQQVVGGEQLAEEDLRLRLESGDVEAQERRVTPGEGIDIIPLAPEDFKDGLLFPRLPERIDSLLASRDAHRRDNLLRRVDRYRSDGRNFFLRRSDVYRIWPIAGASKEAAAGDDADGASPRISDARYGSPPTRSGSCGARVTDGRIEEGSADERSASVSATTD